MSFDAIRWAMEQPVKPAITKFVLVAMAECVNSSGDAMECWPSYAHLTRRTGASQNTVEASVYRLREERYIVDTGRREGGTGKVIVYRLNDPTSGAVTPTIGSEDKSASATRAHIDAGATRAQTTPQQGPLAVSEIPPNLSGNPPKFDTISPQKQGVMTPDMGGGIKKEPGRKKEGTRKRSGFDPTTFPLPEWLDRELWGTWCRDRKNRGKTISEDAAPLQIKALTEYRKNGFSPRDVIEHSIANGWQGLFPPKQGKGPAISGRHSGFQSVNYEEGAVNGIPSA